MKMQGKRDEMPELDTDEVVAVEDVAAKVSTGAENAVKRHSRCPVCNSHLHFIYQTDFHQNLAYESVKCPECSIRIRRVLHRLQ